MALQDLLNEAARAVGPSIVDKSGITPGGVDPLGLRQINFDLMDLVLPNLNNVAAHVRPFIIMTWAWRRARELVEQGKEKGENSDVMRDFVDRVEAIFAWSQFLRDAGADLPGGQALAPVIHAARYRFAGESWERRRDVRRYSTGLIAPVNYGPALKLLGWIRAVDGAPGVFTPNPALDPALDAFQALMGTELEHPAFSRFGDVEVSAEEVARWGGLWAMEKLTGPEMAAAFDRLAGPDANLARRRGCDLIRAAAERLGDADAEAEDIRALMAEGRAEWADDEQLSATAETWRRVQVRQAFRLSLEALFHWLVEQLIDRPRSTDALVGAFLEEATADTAALPSSAARWLAVDGPPTNPTVHLAALQRALYGDSGQTLPSAIVAALAFCIREAPDKGEAFERSDRLPLCRAKLEAAAWGDLTPAAFMAKVIEVWVLAQHVYWCVGRGLADARSRGKSILRLRVVIDEGGWTLTPGATLGGPPNPTPDRLATAISLLRECGQLA